MSDIKKLKEKLDTNEDFRRKFFSVKNENEALLVAKQLGFDVSKEDIENDPELSDDLLSTVAGGKNPDMEYEDRTEDMFVLGKNNDVEVLKKSEYYNNKGGT